MGNCGLLRYPSGEDGCSDTVADAFAGEADIGEKCGRCAVLDETIGKTDQERMRDGRGRMKDEG